MRIEEGGVKREEGGGIEKGKGLKEEGKEERGKRRFEN